jgi:chloramphenicol 3-O-phosphotransferase
MMVDAIVLNGGSSSGKSSLARSLQHRLGPTWVGVRCDSDIADAREAQLPDRRAGMPDNKPTGFTKASTTTSSSTPPAQASRSAQTL